MESMGVGPSPRGLQISLGAVRVFLPKTEEVLFLAPFFLSQVQGSIFVFVNFSSDDDHAGGYLCHHRGSYCE